MATRSIPLRFAFAFAFSFSLSLTVSPSSLPTTPISFLKPAAVSHSAGQAPTRTPSRKLAADLLALLGGPRDAARVVPEEADAIMSCLRFIVPFDLRGRGGKNRVNRRELNQGGCCSGQRDGNDEVNMVRWPPEAVMELARIAVDSGGDPAAVQRELDPTMLPVPDVEGCKADKCQLTSTPYGRRFICEELNSYIAFLFETVVSRGSLVGLDVKLSRYDLFHGHMFLDPYSGRLGILFHAKEYPTYDEKAFPINMGYCQKGSSVAYDDSMNLRNILWLAPLPSNDTRAWKAPGVLVVLDARPDGIIFRDLVPEYVDFVRTIYEADFGEHVADINYLNLKTKSSGERIFIC